MANTFAKLGQITVNTTLSYGGSVGPNAMGFFNIPQTYTDLLILGSTRTDRGTYGTDELLVTINTDTTAANYSHNFMRAQNNVTWDAGRSNNSYPWGAGGNATTNTAGTFGNGRVYISNYSSSSMYKQFITTVTSPSNTTTNLYQMLDAGIYKSNNPIYSIQLNNQGTGYYQYSTFTLYGIKNT